MKNRIRFLCLCLLFSFTNAARVSAKEMSVQVRSGQVRATPSFLGAPTGEVGYGERVKILAEQGAWSRILAPGIGEGWMHSSALTSKKIVLQSGEKDVEIAASGEEMALAGKGFNAEVEAEFKAENKNIDFTWIDKMEKWGYADKELETFLQTGAVTQNEGGR